MQEAEALALGGAAKVTGLAQAGEGMSGGSNSSPSIPKGGLFRRQNQALYEGAWQEHKFKWEFPT